MSNIRWSWIITFFASLIGSIGGSYVFLGSFDIQFTMLVAISVSVGVVAGVIVLTGMFLAYGEVSFIEKEDPEDQDIGPLENDPRDRL